jgi:hypothetical protein
MFRRLVVEQRHPMQREEALLVAHAETLGIPVEGVYLKHMSRGFVRPGSADLVAGTIQFMQHAVRQYGKELAEHTPYPECLKPFMHRKTWQLDTLAQAKAMLDSGRKFFIKPVHWKVFTGFVAEYSDDFRFNGVSNQTPVYLSEVVEFIAEYRAYVAHGEVLTVEFAGGDERCGMIPHPTIFEAVKILTQHGVPAGYAIDFGILTTGQTALVELNDGFSIGAYGNITAEQYWKVIAARWPELIK